MNIFNSIRLAYFDEIINDPEISKEISRINNGWVEGMVDTPDGPQWNQYIKNKKPDGTIEVSGFGFVRAHPHNDEIVVLKHESGALGNQDEKRNYEFFYNIEYDFLFFFRKSDSDLYNNEQKILSKISEMLPLINRKYVFNYTTFETLEGTD